MKTITVNLPDELAANIEARVANGEYDSRDKAVTLAVAEWLFGLEQPPMIDEDNPRLRAMIQSAVEQVERGQVVDGPKAMAELRERTRAKMSTLAVPS